jgi:hypothetical protein
MRDHRAVYRGYAIFVSSAEGKWAFRIERLRSDLPILSKPISEGHASRGEALWTAKRHIDVCLSV